MSVQEKALTLRRVVNITKNWWVYVADFLGLFPKNKLIDLKLRTGGSITLRAGTTDRGTFNEIWLRDMYQPSEFHIRDGMQIVDIGAHIGLFAIWASQKNPSGQIVAIEPSKENFELLQRNIRQCGVKNINVHNAAVSDRPGTLRLYLSNRDPDCHNIFVDESGEYEEVKAVTIEEIMRDAQLSEINYIKIDCEGAEYDILLNANSTMLAKMELVALEVHQKRPDHDPKKLEQLFTRHGFTVSRDGFMLYAKHA